jgi:hypothetical protein
MSATLTPPFEEQTDAADRGEWLFEICVGQWRVVARIHNGKPDCQIDLQFDILLGMGDLYLDRQLTLHGSFGIGPSVWDRAKAGHEEQLAELAGEYCQFMSSAFSDMLAGLSPGISGEEVFRAEEEWKQWLIQSRAERTRQKSRG